MVSVDVTSHDALPIASGWVELPDRPQQPRLRCWWARPQDVAPRAAVLVLPEVFGLNGWVRGVCDRLAAAGYGALALPIFARTAPELELGYDETSLAQGRMHRDAVSADGVLSDAGRAIAWLQQQRGLEQRPVGCVGFCFGGHLAMLVATLPQVDVTVDVYGARVASFRPGGGPPTLALVPQISGDLLCICGERDPLMPPEELEAIQAALAASGSRRRRELHIAAGAGHGFMCDARADFHPGAAKESWSLLLAALVPLSMSETP